MEKTNYSSHFFHVFANTNFYMLDLDTIFCYLLFQKINDLYQLHLNFYMHFLSKPTIEWNWSFILRWRINNSWGRSSWHLGTLSVDLWKCLYFGLIIGNAYILFCVRVHFLGVHACNTCIICIKLHRKLLFFVPFRQY